MQLMISTDTDSPAMLAAVISILSDAITRQSAPLASDDTEDDLANEDGAQQSLAAGHVAIVTAADGSAHRAPPPPVGVIVPPPPSSVAHDVTHTGEQPTTLAAVDSEGAVWNAELHSSSRAKIANGTWKKKRGAAVKADEPPAVAPVVVPPPPTTVVVPPPPGGAVVVPPPPGAVAAVAATGVTFNSVMAKLNAAIQANKITHNRAIEVARGAGCSDLALLVAMPSLCASVDAALDLEIAGK